jgi:hypothetical protein
MAHTCQRLACLMRPLALGALLALALWIAPAEACGCGGYIPNGGDAYVTQEQALLRWDGQTEQIVMTLGVLGGSKEAAVVLPVPAQASVKLGDAQAFNQLGELTRPVIQEQKRYVLPFFMGAAAPPPVGAGAPVTVLSRQTLGPFEVSNLAATDANALVDWLKQNGYELSAGLGDALKPYVAQGWFYVAVRLRPGAGDTLKGTLDPLWVTFSASQLVYPMRASANARQPETVTLYVLADHRVQKTENFGNSQVSFADWLEPAAVRNGSALAPFVDRRLFLTKFEETVNPSQVNADFNFTFASTDEPFHEVIVDYVDDPSLVYLCLIGLGVLLLLLPLILLGGLALFLMRRRRTASQA